MSDVMNVPNILDSEAAATGNYFATEVILKLAGGADLEKLAIEMAEGIEEDFAKDQGGDMKAYLAGYLHPLLDLIPDLSVKEPPAG